MEARLGWQKGVLSPLWARYTAVLETSSGGTEDISAPHFSNENKSFSASVWSFVGTLSKHRAVVNEVFASGELCSPAQFTGWNINE